MTTIAPATLFEETIAVWKDADRVHWRAAELSYKCVQAGYTRQDIGKQAGYDGDTIGSYVMAYDLRQRLTATHGDDVISYICSMLTVSHFRYASVWERQFVRWFEGADPDERKLAEREKLATKAEREHRLYVWLGNCIDSVEYTIKSARAFQRELAALTARLMGRDEGRALFQTFESWLPRLEEYALSHVDAFDATPKQVRELKRLTRLARATRASIGRYSSEVML